MAAILGQLPEWSSRRADRYPVRAYFEVAAETGLRPATLQGLRYPKHWRRGATTLQIPPELDKARWGREVPLSARALAALHAVAPEGGGMIFGEHPYHEGWLRPAAARAGLPLERARRVVPSACRRHAWVSRLAPSPTRGTNYGGTSIFAVPPFLSCARALPPFVSKEIAA